MPVVPVTDSNLQKAASIIREGGLVAFPTETVYGLGADAWNPEACARIFEVKNRPFFDPLILHLAEYEMVFELCSQVDPRADRLMKKFWPGPLTVVLSKVEKVPDIVTAGLPTVAVRIPAHAAARELIRLAKTPIAAPSANPFGRLSPTTAKHVEDQIGENVDLILDGGPCEVGVESTIVAFIEDKPYLLRPGGIPLEEIEKEIGPVEIMKSSQRSPLSPGLLSRHYSPRTPFIILSGDLPKIDPGKKIGFLAFQKPPKSGIFQTVEILSPSGDLREAAVNLFACLHRLDNANLDIIYAEPVPEEGLGRAIMDRLRKAAGKG